MSRSAVQLGHRARTQTPLRLLSRCITTASVRPLVPALSTPTQSQLIARHFRIQHTRSTALRATNTYRDVATKNTFPLWVGSSAQITSTLGLRKSLHTNTSRSLLSESPINRQLRNLLPRRRLFSDEKISEAAKQNATAASKSTPRTPNSSESAKTTQQAAAGGAASKGLLDRLSHLPHLHRPTKYELLATAEGFWQRLRINFKWISIRSLRPFTIDEIGAFISWVFLGHVLWIVIGTTTFVSLAIWAVNTVFAQETLAGWVGNYLTKSSGIKVVFESAIVPTWKSGVITFSNVFVSRRPGSQTGKERAVKKGSSITAAAAAAEAATIERTRDVDDDDDGNYTQFDVTMQTVNVTLSFSKWFNGKGLLRDVEVVGVRGVIDRTSVQPRDYSIDPKSYRHNHDTGDFEIDNFKMSDVLLTVHQPDNFRPFTVSVFNCDLPRLRKQWLFYDFMGANNMSGSFDDSLFTVHPRQIHGTTGAPLVDGVEEGEGQQWKKHSRLRIDGLNIDHLNRGVDGPLGWIREGNVDIVADVMIPGDEGGVWRQSWRKSTEAMSELYDRVEASVAGAQGQSRAEVNNDVVHSVDQGEKEHSPTATSSLTTTTHQSPADKRLLIFDITIHLNAVHASVPLFTRDLSYVNNALVRPIVAYINSRGPRAFIPVSCRVVKRQSEFDGSWTVFDSGLLDDLSRETYEACARDIEDGGARKRRIRKVGLWSLQLAAQALFVGMATALV